MFRYLVLKISILLLILVNGSVAFANGMPYIQMPGDVSGTITPVSNNSIKVIKEDLTIKFDSRESAMIFNPGVSAHVESKYTLVNLTENQLEVPVAFPQPGQPNNWEITLDGEELVPGETKEVEKSSIETGNKQLEWINPFTGESYLPENHRGQPMKNESVIRATTFMLPLKPGEQQLKVSFRANTGMDEKSGLSPVYRFRYLLSPAANWASFENLKINVYLPFKHSLQSTVPLQQIGDYSWQGQFKQLPEENLILYFAPVTGIWGGLVNSRPAALSLLGVLVIIMILLRRYLFPKLGYRSGLILNLLMSIVVAWVSYITFSYKIFSYPFSVLQYLLLGLLLAWLFLVPWIKLALKKDDG